MGINCCKQGANFVVNEFEVLTITSWDGVDIEKKTENSGQIVRNILNIVEIMHDTSIKQCSPYFHKQVPNFDTPNFTDTLFPPNEKSITFIDRSKSVSSCINDEDTNPLKGLIWLRPIELFPGGKFKIHTKMDIEDIHQGVLGNCYYLSSLSAIAENPGRLDKLIVNKETSKNGCYAFNIYIQGKRKTVVLDDYFPCFKSKKFAMATSGEGEIWVQLFEKLWAKLNQSYTMTIAGLPSEALSVLTEAPVITYIHKKYEPDEIWKILKGCDDHNYIMCTTTNQTSGKEVGLVPSHAYTLVSCFDLDGLKLIKIRNPWGTGFEWNGDFGDKSNKWTPELKKAVKFQDTNDGIFYMTFSDFLKYYPYTFVCKYHDGWEYKFKKVEQGKQDKQDTMMGLRFQISKKTKAIIGLHQKSERFYSKVPNYKFSYCKLFLVKILGEHYEFIQSNEGSIEKIYLDLEKDLEPGDYYIFGKVKWNYMNFDSCSVIFSVYSDNKDLDFIQINRSLIKPDYITRMFDNFIDRTSVYKPISQNSNGLHYSVSLNDTDTGFFWISFRNNNPKDTAKISFHVTKNSFVETLSKNVSIQSLSGKELFTVEVPPSSQELILFEQLDNTWACKIAIGGMEVNWSHGTYDPEEDRNYISEKISASKREAIIGKDVYCAQIKKNNCLLLALQNVSKNDYMIKVSLRDLVNASIAYPFTLASFSLLSEVTKIAPISQINQFSSTNIKVYANSVEFIKLVPETLNVMDYKLVYSYKNLTQKEPDTARKNPNNNTETTVKPK